MTYLADIGAFTGIPAAQLAERQLRAAVWFGIAGYVNSGEENASPDNPNWNQMAWAWEQTVEHVAEHIAQVTAEDIAQLYNGDSDNDADRKTVAALAAMFAIPLDVIAVRATETLYSATRADGDTGDTDTAAADDTDGVTMVAIAGETAAISADDLTDPDYVISVENISYFRKLADAQ